MIIKLILLLIYNNIKPQQTLQSPSYNSEVIQEKINTTKTKEIVEAPIGTLQIKSINLNNKIYSTNSIHNNIEENVTIIKSAKNIESKDSLIILAAHSGHGQIAYFNNLNMLEKGDQIILTIYNTEYIFIVNNIFEQPKNGHIKISKQENSQLILTTCSTTNLKKQLIVESTIKES